MQVNLFLRYRFLRHCSTAGTSLPTLTFAETLQNCRQISFGHNVCWDTAILQVHLFLNLRFFLLLRNCRTAGTSLPAWTYFAETLQKCRQISPLFTISETLQNCRCISSFLNFLLRRCNTANKSLPFLTLCCEAAEFQDNAQRRQSRHPMS